MSKNNTVKIIKKKKRLKTEEPVRQKYEWQRMYRRGMGGPKLARVTAHLGPT